MTETVLSDRRLNRALLARQWLLAREKATVDEAVAHLAGMQSQDPKPAYLSLWSRVEGFTHAMLSEALLARRLVRLAMMRSTIHLVTASDAYGFRPLVAPVLSRGFQGAYGKLIAGVDLPALHREGLRALKARALTFAELGEALAPHWPSHDAKALAQAMRTVEPLVQVTPRGVWGESSAARHLPLSQWVVPALPSSTLDAIVLRYLAAFGPASVKDAQTWSGLTKLQPVLDGLRDRLVTFRDARGVRLYDLPDAPRPDEDTPAPVRLLGEWDNLYLSHADRRRVIDDDERAKVFTVNGIIRATALVDGRIAATWKLIDDRHGATIHLTPLRKLTRKTEDAIAEEATRAVHFLAPDALRPGVSFEAPEQ